MFFWLKIYEYYCGIIVLIHCYISLILHKPKMNAGLFALD